MRKPFYRSHQRHLSKHHPKSQDFTEDVDELVECMTRTYCPNCVWKKPCTEYVKTHLNDGTIIILSETNGG